MNNGYSLSCRRSDCSEYVGGEGVVWLAGISNSLAICCIFFCLALFLPFDNLHEKLVFILHDSYKICDEPLLGSHAPDMIVKHKLC